MSSQPPRSANLLRHMAPEALQRLVELHRRFGSSLAARTNAQLGGHTSAQRGQSVEFHEHRAYQSGDDPRHLDWRGSARRDRLMLKRFDHEGQITRALLVDASASMRVGEPDGHGPTKLGFACTCLSVVAHVLAQGGDPLRLAALAARESARAPLAAMRRYTGPAVLSDPLTLANTLASLGDIAETIARGGTTLTLDLDHIANQLAHHPAEIIIASDFFDHGDIAGLLQAMAARGHAITVLMVLAASEQTLPFRGLTTFVSPETGLARMTNPAEIRPRYLAAMRRHVASWQARCHASGMRFVLGTSDVEATAAQLLGLVAQREAWPWA